MKVLISMRTLRRIAVNTFVIPSTVSTLDKRLKKHVV